MTKIIRNSSTSILVFNISFSGVIIIFAGFFPIIFFESNPLALNWCFALSQGLSGLVGMAFSLYMIFIGNSLVKAMGQKLKKSSNPSAGNAPLDAMKKKFKKFTLIFYQLCVNASITAIGIPLWMGLSTQFGIGMHYFFYVYFFFLLPSEIGIVFLLFWMVQKNKETGSKGSRVESSMERFVIRSLCLLGFLC